MSWSYQDWKQDDDIFYGYITPLRSAEYYQFDATGVFCGFKTDSQFYGYPHTVYGVAPSFDVNKVYHYFECNDAFYGYPAALGITFNPLGAFMNCTNLTSLEIPESVYELGPHTFFQSGLESTTISPDCIFYDTTFPSGCTLSYYPFTTNISSQLPNILNVYCFEGDKLVNEIYSKNLTITVNNKITRNLENYLLADVDTSKEYTNVRGAIVGKSSLDDLGYFRYTTTAFDISDGLFEQGGLNNSGAEITDSTSIRSVNMFPSTGGLYRFIYELAGASLVSPSLKLKIYRYTTDGSFISSSLLGSNPLTVSNLDSDIDIGGATYMVRLVLTNANGNLAPENLEYGKFVKIDRFNFSYCKDSNSNGAASKASTTNTVRCYEPCKLVLAVLHRPDITISDNTFTFLYTSTLPDTARNQRISIWTKDVQAGEHSVTVTPSDPALLYQSELLCIYDVNSISVYEDKIMSNYTYTVPAKESPCRRLYLSSSLYAPSNNDAAISISGTNSKSYTMNNNNFSSDGSSRAQNRYVTVYDYDDENTSVPTFSYTSSYTEDSMNVVTLDIT